MHSATDDVSVTRHKENPSKSWVTVYIFFIRQDWVCQLTGIFIHEHWRKKQALWENIDHFYIFLLLQLQEIRIHEAVFDSLAIKVTHALHKSGRIGIILFWMPRSASSCVWVLSHEGQSPWQLAVYECLQQKEPLVKAGSLLEIMFFGFMLNLDKFEGCKGRLFDLFATLRLFFGALCRPLLVLRLCLPFDQHFGREKGQGRLFFVWEITMMYIAVFTYIWQQIYTYTAYLYYIYVL